ncbi:RhoGAP domain containing protein [Aphelenchoides bicaudatus]|nr:RhoGAP domain containing protein [Aphelenchoides bicaudatus]
MNGNAYSTMIQNPITPAHFSHEQIEQILHEVCIGQFGTNYADMRVRISFLCDDPFTISQVLSPLLEHTVQIDDDSGGCFCVDVLAEEHVNIRVCNYAVSFHSWMLSKWMLSSFNGHILIYSPSRLASWRHAEIAVQLLLDAATVVGSSNVLERQCMSQSILLLAVEDPSNFFTDKDSSHLLNEGARLAERVGCRFMAISQSMTHSAQYQMYSEFYVQLMQNQPLPNLPYTVCAPNQSSFATKRRPTYFSANATSTFTGSANTLLSSSSASHESNLSVSASCAPEPHSVVANNNYNTADSKSRHSTREHSRQRRSIESRNGPLKLLNVVDSQVPTTSQPSPHYSQEPNGQLAHPPASRRERSSSRHSTFVEPNRTVSSIESKASEMSNRLRRPLSAIGSFMSGGSLSAHAAENSPSHESSSNSIAPETHSNKIKFSPSGFRKLFQRNTAGSESSASADDQARKKLHRSSTVEEGSAIVAGGQNPSVQVNGCRLLEVVPASPQNSYTSYVHVLDPEDISPLPKNPVKRPMRAVLKSLSVDSEDTTSKSPVPPNGSVRFAHDSENIPQRTDNVVNKMEENYERPSRLRRFADRFTRKNRQNGPRRRQSLPSKRLDSAATSSPTSGSSNSPIDMNYESECQGDEIPVFSKQCVQYIEKNGGLMLEGLYRLSGHPTLIAELEQKYRKTGALCVERLVDDTRGSKETALIAVSAAFKRYLQSFNEPLIPTKINEELLELISDRGDIDDQTPLATRAIDSMRRLFERALPRVNARLLAFICAHLERVAMNSEKNKMNAKNLSLIWAGTLFRMSPSTPISDATERMTKFPILVFFFIKHYSILFCDL